MSTFHPAAYYYNVSHLPPLQQNKYDISIYPSYHTGYDTFHTVSQLVDPGFKIHTGCSRLALLTLRQFADSAVIPYSLSDLPIDMTGALAKILETNDNRQTLLNIYDKLREYTT